MSSGSGGDTKGRESAGTDKGGCRARVEFWRGEREGAILEGFRGEWGAAVV